MKKKKKKLHSLVLRNFKPIYRVSGNALWDLFKGSCLDIFVNTGTATVPVRFKDILIAYNGEYLPLDSFARNYDSEEGDYPIINAIYDACIEAVYQPMYRRNKNTKKDKVLATLASLTPTNNEEIR